MDGMPMSGTFTRDVLAGINDPVLRLVVGLAETQDVQVGITVSLHGVVVTGYVVSAERYTEWLSGDYVARLPEGLFQEGDASRQDMAECLAQLSEQRDMSAPAYLHIRNAQICQPGQPFMPREGGFWWRCRVDDVTGYSLQRLTPTANPGAHEG